MPDSVAIRGCFFDLTADPWPLGCEEAKAARLLSDGLMLIDNGCITALGPYDALRHRLGAYSLVSIEDKLIVPGFIDGHIHFPQVRVMGVYGRQLLEWLQSAIFPEELRFRDRAYAEAAAKTFFDALLAAGTTTCQAFTTASPVSTEVFFDEALSRGMRVIAGLTGIDRFAPDASCIDPDSFYAESKRLIATYHRRDRCLYAITPRFAIGCSEAMLAACRRLKEEFPDCWINTHIAESPAEIRESRLAFPDCRDDTAIHEKHGLLGPKFTAGHGVWLSNDELRRFSVAGAALCFCPLSNLFLGSGLFRLGKAMDPTQPVRVCLGTDVGAGNSFSLLRVMEEAYKVGLCNTTILDGSLNIRDQDLEESQRNQLSAYRAFYLATLGGAKALYLDDRIGNFDPGKEADFVVLDLRAGQQALAWRQDLACEQALPTTVPQAADLLFGLLACGDDRNVAQTWVQGRQVYGALPRR